ncbi:MAG: Bifunctional NAD(P)H-hydrate repair enzyme Nnr [Syntrophus sp. SKADARSKE-3]|nr:Bifunctional NAD(P)H-hydrate repair enzyme Nnr [Syntrophus sp. SKADARSKE-3]
MKVARVKEMQEMDKHAISELDIPEEILMENAGMAAISVIDREMGIRGKRYAVICGIGNNGGDGFVVARKIHSNGGCPRVFILGDEERFRNAAASNLQILKRLAIPITRVTALEELRRGIIHVDGIIDGIFGTGLDRPVQGLHGDVIACINTAGKKILSLDIPSGISGETGNLMGTAVKADWTVAFGLPKVGNILYPGYAHCGKLYISHISFPPALYNRKDLKIEINETRPLPPRDPQAHKGSVGQCLFVAGAAGYFGAPYFAAMSFLKAGGGYSRLAAPESMTGFLAQKGPEIVFLPQIETPEGAIAAENDDALIAMSEKADMVVIGPGLSLALETQRLVRKLVRKIRKPILIDGDGITAIAEELSILRERTAPTILTPHIGEMSRLTGQSIKEIQENKIHILQQTAIVLQTIIILKGAHTLIGYPDGRVFINMTGNPGMATAGSGDVLTGTIAAMAGLGLSVEDAVRKGVFVHGLAGDLATDLKGADGMTAQDILENLPEAMRHERIGETEDVKRRGFVICP